MSRILVQRFFQIFSPIGIVILAIACSTDTKTSQHDSDSTAIDSNLAMQIYSDQAPEWMKQLPEQAGFIYAAGEGISSRLSLAEDKALLRAQTKLANEMEKILHEQMTTAPGGAQSDESDITDSMIDISGFSVLKQQREEAEGKWYVYILLEKELDR